jgi:hypothetical protein
MKDTPSACSIVALLFDRSSVAHSARRRDPRPRREAKSVHGFPVGAGHPSFAACQSAARHERGMGVVVIERVAVVCA